MTRQRLLLFDCDGTMVDSQHMIAAAMARAFDAHGLQPLPRERVLSIVGLSLQEAVGTLLPEAEPAGVAAVAESYRQAFFELRGRPELAEPLFAGTREALERCRRRGFALGIATGKSRRGVKTLLQTHDLEEFFQTIQTADDAPSKPHPAMVEQAMAEADAPASATVLIGDTTYDMEMARAAGTSAIGVSWGYHDAADLEAAGAHRVIGSFEALDEAIDAVTMVMP